MWSRRQFLGALAASGTGAALAPLLGCGARGSQAILEQPKVIEDEHLLTALALLDPSLDDPRVWSRRTHGMHLSIDHETERFDQRTQHLVILEGQRGGATVQSALHSPTQDELLRAAVHLANNTRARAVDPGPTRRVTMPSPASWELKDYQSPLRTMFSRAQRHGSSRIIFRSCHLDVFRTEQRILSRSKNLQIEGHRSRAGVFMATWTGREVATGEAQVCGAIGPEGMVLTQEVLAGVADAALAHLHARGAPTGQQEVLLSAAAAAYVVYHAIAPARALLPADYDGLVRVTDDSITGYGRLSHDDDGNVCTPQTLIGTEAVPNTTRGRKRFDEDARSIYAPGHLRMETGERSESAMVAHMQRGVFLEGPQLCTLDPQGRRFSLIASRCREVLNGRFTGRLFGRTILTASLDDFVRNTTALGIHSETMAFDYAGIASSVEAPLWLSRGQVEGL